MKKFIMLPAILFLILLSGCILQKNPISELYTSDTKIADDSNTFNLNDNEQTLNGQNLLCSANFEGSNVIWSYEAKEEEELDMTYIFNIQEGRAKLVFISPDGAVTDLIERSSEAEPAVDYSVNKFTVTPGLNRIKLVADKNTWLDLDLTIPEGELQEVGFH